MCKHGRAAAAWVFCWGARNSCMVDVAARARWVVHVDLLPSVSLHRCPLTTTHTHTHTHTHTVHLCHFVNAVA